MIHSQTKTQSTHKTENSHIWASRHIIDSKDMNTLLSAFKKLSGKPVEVTEENTEEIQNLIKWKKAAEKKYAYDGEKPFFVSNEMQKRIDMFAQDDNTHFNEFLECIVMIYLDAKIKENKPRPKYKMYKASKSDDISSGVDYIIRSTNEQGQVVYQGIDLGLGENKEALVEKGVRSRAKCLEFNIRNGLPEDTAMSRVLLSLDKYLVYSLANECLQTIFTEGELEEDMMSENFEYAQTSFNFKKFLQWFCDTRASVESTVKEFNFQIMSIVSDTKKARAYPQIVR